jgi:hypothetical protein
MIITILGILAPCYFAVIERNMQYISMNQENKSKYNVTVRYFNEYQSPKQNSIKGTLY